MHHAVHPGRQRHAESAASGQAELLGPVYHLPERAERLTGIMLDMLRRIEAEPSTFGASSHLLTIAHRPAA
jgi:hypothetical protein